MSLNVFFSFILAFSIQVIKGTITCGEFLETNPCYNEYYIPEDKSIIFVNPCKFGYYCAIENGDYGPVCAKRIIPSGENDECFNNIDCGIGTCENGRCKVRKDGEECYYDEYCEEQSICNEDNVCAPMRTLGEPCNQSTDCEIGLECINDICQNIFTGENGDQVNDEKACMSGFTIDKEFSDGVKTICANFTVKSQCDGENYCYGFLDDGVDTYSNYQVSCNKNWDNQYICPSERFPPYKTYIDSFSEGLLGLKNLEKNRVINRYTLNNPSVTGFLLDYHEYYNSYGAEDCVRYFFYRLLEFSTFISISSAFYILILIF